MLETVDLTIRFGGHVAVDAVSCRFEPGTLTSIVGPNGAGKTTYFNLISGQLQASAGRVLLDGEDLTRLPAPLRTRRGLGRAFQLTQLFPNLSVLENVRLAVQAREQGRAGGGRLGGQWSRQRKASPTSAPGSIVFFGLPTDDRHRRGQHRPVGRALGLNFSGPWFPSKRCATRRSRHRR